MGRSYRPLKWSAYLKDSAQKWANHLAATGTFVHGSSGENLASHTDWNGYNRSTSNILTRWVEEEMNKSYPSNGHMTQVLWRATEYVGCGEARRGNKFYQVCHYSKPGNCNVRSSSNVWPDVLADDSPCAGKRLLYWVGSNTQSTNFHTMTSVYRVLYCALVMYLIESSFWT